jgi:hypothetical protein
VQNNSAVSVVLLLIGYGAIHSGSDSISCSDDNSSNNHTIDDTNNNIPEIQHSYRAEKGEKIESLIAPISNLCIQLSILRCAERNYQDSSMNKSQSLKLDISLSLAIKASIVRLKKEQIEDKESDQNNCFLVLDALLENCNRSAILFTHVGHKEDFLRDNTEGDKNNSGDSEIRVTDTDPSLLDLQTLSPLCLAAFTGCPITLKTILNSFSLSGNLNAEMCFEGLNPITCCAIASVECLIAIKNHMGDEEFRKACSSRDGIGLTPLTALLHIIKAQASHSRNIENRLIPSNTYPNSLLHIKMNSDHITQILEILLQDQKVLNLIPHGLTPATPESPHSIFSIRYDNLKNRLQNIESRLHILITFYQPPNPFKPTPLSQTNSILSQITQKDTNSSHINNNIPYPNNKTPSIISSDLSSMIIQMEQSEQFQKVNAVITNSQEQWLSIKKSFFTPPSLRLLMRTVKPDVQLGRLSDCLLFLLNCNDNVECKGLPLPIKVCEGVSIYVHICVCTFMCIYVCIYKCLYICM